MIKRVGFLGMGDIGLPMAKRVVTNGYDVTVCGNLRREPVEGMKKLGAKEVASPKEVALASDVIISVVRDNEQTSKIVFGENGILAGAKKGSVIILMSTLTPAFCKQVAEAAKAKNVDVIDAPVSGASVAAEKGQLVIAVGGNRETIEKCRPVLATMSKAIIYAGDVGMGQVVKLTNNMALLANMIVAAEAISWGMKNGASEENLLQFMKEGTSNSWVLQNWEFLKQTLKNPVTLTLAPKDLSLGLQIAHEIGQSCPMAALTLEIIKGRIGEKSAFLT
jgi:3-hydroxyisobutyrate dehydrogenase